MEALSAAARSDWIGRIGCVFQRSSVHIVRTKNRPAFRSLRLRRTYAHTAPPYPFSVSPHRLPTSQARHIQQPHHHPSFVTMINAVRNSCTEPCRTREATRCATAAADSISTSSTSTNSHSGIHTNITTPITNSTTTTTATPAAAVQSSRRQGF